VNFLRGRGRRFKRALDKLEHLAEFTRRSDVDLVLFSGDFTAMGTRAEFAAARTAIEPFLGTPAGFVCVPGNHDLYTRAVLRQRRFERTFEDLLDSDLPEGAVDGPWPLVRLVGSDAAVLALNSARPNPIPWRSSGRVPQVQVDAARDLLRRPELANRFVFVVTHYAPCLWDGSPDTKNHGLVNAGELLDLVSGIPRGAVLCGHVHRTFRVRLPGVRPEIFCAGSATMHELEGFWMFDLEEGRIEARQGRWTGSGYALEAEG
jgi:3',5'-cyclic AMP phosphodiesterase CpdA